MRQADIEKALEIVANSRDDPKGWGLELWFRFVTFVISSLYAVIAKVTAAVEIDSGDPAHLLGPSKAQLLEQPPALSR